MLLHCQRIYAASTGNASRPDSVVDFEGETGIWMRAAQRTSENQTLIIFGFGYLILNSMSECRMSRKRRVQPPSFQELP